MAAVQQSRVIQSDLTAFDSHGQSLGTPLGRRLAVWQAAHSAGGHLAAMMLGCQWPQFDTGLPPHVVRAALALSGIFELEPLRHAPFLAADLKLSARAARALSPAHMPAPSHGRLVAVVGGDESPEFRRQTAPIRQAWGPRAVPICETVPGRHPMNVVHALAEPDSRVHSLALALLGLGPAPPRV